MNETLYDKLDSLVTYDARYTSYTYDEKRKYLLQAIIECGFYNSNNQWNSILYLGDDKVYRGRVETLIIKQDKFIFLKFLPKERQTSSLKYLVPGGSIEKDVPNIIQAVNECKEEAYMRVKKIKYSGIVYNEDRVPPKYALSEKVNWTALHTEVYTAEYDGKYTGYIDLADRDSILASGKFYNIYNVYKYLKPAHREALDNLYPNRFNSMHTQGKFIDIKDTLSSKEFGIPSQRKFPIYDKYHTLKSIKYFNTVKPIYEKELAYNIKKRMKLYDISPKIVDSTNRLRKYL